MKCSHCGIDMRFYGHNTEGDIFCYHKNPAPQYIIEALTKSTTSNLEEITNRLEDYVGKLLYKSGPYR